MSERPEQPSFSWKALAADRRVLALAATLLAAAPLVACYGPEYESVHFNSARPDFFRMPRPWPGVPSEKRALLPGEPETAGYGEAPKRRSVALAAQAAAQEKAGQFLAAARSWEQCLAAVAREDTPWAYFADNAPPVQGLEDRIAALKAWRSAADTEPLRLYLRARSLVTANRGKEAVPLLASFTREPYRTHAEYLRGSILFLTDGDADAAAQAFARLTQRKPDYAAAQYMLARCRFSEVRTDELAAAESAAPNQSTTETEDPLTAEERTSYLNTALKGYQACLDADPRGPLADSARGMLGACYFRLKQYPDALLQYCRQLAALPPGSENFPAWLSARRTLKEMSLADHKAFQARVLAEPETAAAYLDMHLHYGRLGVRANYNLGLFTLDLLKRHPGTAVSGKLLNRLAMMEERFARPERAEQLSAAAMKALAPGADQDQARWTHARALHGLKKAPEALAEYERLAASAALPKMRRGAMEAAAVLSEQQGDYPNALRHYFALNYRTDYAYLIDVLAAQDDLKAFLTRYPSHPQAKLVKYSLGFRQLRARQFKEAEETFASLGDWLETAEKKFACNTYRDEARRPPLETARFLADAQRREADAETPEEKAKVAYEVGRMFFRQRYLLLYNGVLWDGGRVYAFNVQAPGNVTSRSNAISETEKQLQARHHEEHTCLYQALKTFERLADRYPRTPEAPQALYSAALCYTLLSHMDSFWANRDIDYYGKAVALYHRIQREYPTDPLAMAAAKFGGPVRTAGGKG